MRESSKGERDEEQETAEISGVRPQSVDNPDFEPMAQVGPIKWVVLESSQLLTDPSLVANTVLTASEAVIAAGDYIDVVEGNERFCIEVTTNSDLNQADDQSDGGRGDRNSGGHGDGNGGGGGDGTEGGDEALSSSSDNQSNDGYGEIGVNIYEKWSVKDMWQMLASRKRAGDEGISQGSGVQVEHVEGDSQAQLSEVVAQQGTERGESGNDEGFHSEYEESSNYSSMESGNSDVYGEIDLNKYEFIKELAAVWERNNEKRDEVIQDDGGEHDGGHGDGNGGSDGTDGGDEALSISSDKRSNDEYGEIGVNIYEEWSVKDMWQMLAGRKRDGDERQHDGGSGDGNGDSDATIQQETSEQAPLLSQQDQLASTSGTSHLGMEQLIEWLSKMGADNGENDAERLLKLLQDNSRKSWGISEIPRECLEEFNSTSGMTYVDIASWGTSGNFQQWSEEFRITSGTNYADIASWSTSGNQQQWSEFCSTSGTNSSDLVVATFELKEKIRLIEEKLSANGHADKLQIIERVRQEKRIVGIDEWVAQSANREAVRMLDTVMELAEAQRQLQKYIDDPKVDDSSVRVYVGQDIDKGFHGEAPFDIVIKKDGKILRQIEVQVPVCGNQSAYTLLMKAIVHAAHKIPDGVREGSTPCPPGELEATIAIVPWPFESSIQEGGVMKTYDTHGNYVLHSATDQKVIYREGSLLEEVVYQLNRPRWYNQDEPVEFIKRLTVIDQNGQALCEFTNETPGVCPARWSGRDLQGQ